MDQNKLNFFFYSYKSPIFFINHSLSQVNLTWPSQGIMLRMAGLN